jgi:hypothetical protein
MNVDKCNKLIVIESLAGGQLRPYIYNHYDSDELAIKDLEELDEKLEYGGALWFTMPFNKSNIFSATILHASIVNYYVVDLDSLIYSSVNLFGNNPIKIIAQLDSRFVNCGMNEAVLRLFGLWDMFEQYKNNMGDGGGDGL